MSTNIRPRVTSSYTLHNTQKDREIKKIAELPQDGRLFGMHQAKWRAQILVNRRRKQTGYFSDELAPPVLTMKL